MDEQTWRNLGFDKQSEQEMCLTLEKIFAEELEGHSLIPNRSLWRNFPNITNKTWVLNNAVLVERMVGISRGLGREIATPDEARKILGLARPQ